MSVTPLRQAPPLTDVAACLRREADRIEAGADVELAVLVLVDRDGGVVPAFFGSHPRTLEAIGALHAAAHKLERSVE